METLVHELRRQEHLRILFWQINYLAPPHARSEKRNFRVFPNLVPSLRFAKRTNSRKIGFKRQKISDLRLNCAGSEFSVMLDFHFSSGCLSVVWNQSESKTNRSFENRAFLQARAVRSQDSRYEIKAFQHESKLYECSNTELQGTRGRGHRTGSMWQGHIRKGGTVRRKM